MDHLNTSKATLASSQCRDPAVPELESDWSTEQAHIKAAEIVMVFPETRNQAEFMGSCLLMTGSKLQLKSCESGQKDSKTQLMWLNMGVDYEKPAYL